MKEIDGLLVKYMLGEADADEIRLVNEWMAESDANRRHFEQFKTIWETGELLKQESKLDPDKSWIEFKQLTQDRENRSRFVTRRWLQMAAVLLVFFGVAAIAYSLLRPTKQRMLAFNTVDKTEIDTLSDGSVITLNRNSSIAYPDHFTGDTREITLNKGEAFFNIAHNKQKPFLIHINDAVVRVVGTSFNIKKGQTNTQVIVETGVVQVIHKKVVVKLMPKDKAEIDSQSGRITKGQNPDAFYNYYRTHQLVADKTPLRRVAEVLNDAYGANISVPDKKLATRTLNTTLNLTSLDDNLRIIAETFKVKITRNPGKIIIQ